MATSRNSMATNWTAADLNTTWYYGLDGPKNASLQAGKDLKHQVFLEQVTDRGRRFGSYPDVNAMAQAIGTVNHNLFEILPQGAPVKAYFDVDYVGDAGELQDILAKLTTAFQDVFNLSLSPADIRISCASGQGESGGYVGKVKRSYHVILDNGCAFSSVQQARSFTNMAFGDDKRVDRAPYGKNQSFKLIHNSKLGSARVQIPQDGHSYQQHMVTSFAEPPSFYNTDKLHSVVKRTTLLQALAPLPVPIDKPLFVADDVDIHSVSSLLSYFPNGPSKTNKQPFDVFLAVACICRNEDEPFLTLERWASLYDGWSLEKTLRIWNSLNKRLDGFDIRTLRTMLNTAHPGILNTIQQKLIHQVIFPTIDYAAHNIDYHEYCEPRMLPFLPHAATKHIMIRGGMGTGKTHQIVEMIRELKPSSVLVITPRQLFARSMLGTMRSVLPDLRIYKDTPKDERQHHPFMVCQLESLWTLCRTYDFVILDESESILAQFSSPTIKDFNTICQDFKAIVLAASTIIHSDAFLSDRTLLTCAALDPAGSKCFIWNKWVQSGRTAYCAGHYQKGKLGLLKAAHLLKDQNNVVVSASCHYAKQLVAVLEPSGPSLFISSAASDDVKKGLEDINGLLQPYKHFIYTSSITVGCSYDRRDHFDNLIM